MPFVTRTRRDTPETTPETVPKMLPGISIPFTKSSDRAVVHVLENPPMSVGVSFKLKVKTRRGTWSKRPAQVIRWKIEVPWQYFMVRMNRVGAITDTFLWFAQRKIQDVEDTVYLPPLPNIYPSGHICNGTIRVNLDDPPHVRVVQAFESFWTTPFTEETWPENLKLIPKCWSTDVDHSNQYFIEYGYLRYIFEYWARHDVKHSKDEWLKNHPSCRFPWRIYTCRNKAMPDWDGGMVQNLGEAMEYALDFVTPKNHD